MFDMLTDKYILFDCSQIVYRLSLEKALIGSDSREGGKARRALYSIDCIHLMHSQMWKNWK